MGSRIDVDAALPRSDMSRFLTRKWTWDQAVSAINSPNVELAVEASEELYKLADPSRIPELYRLMNNPSFFVREAAAAPLAELEGAKALHAMLTALERGHQDGHDNDGLLNTVTGLLEANAETCRLVLLGMLGSDNKLDREHAAWAWGYICAIASPDPLLDLLRTETNVSVRVDAIGSLASFSGDERVFQLLMTAAHDADQEVRLSAISSLGYYKDQRAKPVLEEIAKSNNQELQNVAKFALKCLKSK